MVNKAKRKVAAECLGLLIDFKQVHHLWRLHSVWAEGLTSGERKYLKNCEDDLKAVYERIGKLQYRLNRTT